MKKKTKEKTEKTKLTCTSKAKNTAKNREIGPVKKKERA